MLSYEARKRKSRSDVLYALGCIFFMFVMVPVFMIAGWIILDFIDFIAR